MDRLRVQLLVYTHPMFAVLHVKKGQHAELIQPELKISKFKLKLVLKTYTFLLKSYHYKCLPGLIFIFLGAAETFFGAYQCYIHQHKPYIPIFQIVYGIYPKKN